MAGRGAVFEPARVLLVARRIQRRKVLGAAQASDSWLRRILVVICNWLLCCQRRVLGELTDQNFVNVPISGFFGPPFTSFN